MAIKTTISEPPFLSFSDYIKKLPTQWVFEHFLTKSASSRQILSSSAINERIRQFSQPGALAALYESLEPELQTECALTYLLGATGLVADGPKDLSDPLIRSFLVYASRNARGDIRYFGFPEFENVLRPHFAAKVAATAPVKGKVSPIPERHGNCINDITMTVILASQGVLEKKKLGGLTRNALLKIGKLTHEASLLQEQEGLAGLLLNFCVHAGMIQENETGYYLIADLFEGWLLRPVSERSAEIIDFAIGYSGSWRTDLLHELVKHAGSGWLSCTVFPEEARKSAIDTLRILCWAGLVALSRAGTDTVFGMPCDRGPDAENRGLSAQKTGAIVLMPDFNAVLPPEVSSEHLYRFGKIGTLQSLDRVYKGAVSREILNDALSNGLEGTRVMEWLAEWAAPANVVATVREWVREFYRLYISSGSMLITTEEKVSFQIASFGPLKPYLEPVPSHATFRIKRGAEEKVREYLGQMGFDYRMPDRDRQMPRPRHDDSKENTPAVPPAQACDPGDGGLIEAWRPIVEITAAGEGKPLVLRGKKYGAGLKTLDLNEIMHIIDYAILTGTELVLDYAGSPFVKKGEYTVTPSSCSKGADPQLDAKLKNGLKRQFNVRKISKIGVGIS
jgi:hypothetical protein